MLSDFAGITWPLLTWHLSCCLEAGRSMTTTASNSWQTLQWILGIPGCVYQLGALKLPRYRLLSLFYIVFCSSFLPSPHIITHLQADPRRQINLRIYICVQFMCPCNEPSIRCPRAIHFHPPGSPWATAHLQRPGAQLRLPAPLGRAQLGAHPGGVHL